jgi:methylated-DNA-[protein]-cysteine S-methyltransferase
MFFYETEIGRIGIAENGSAVTNLWFECEDTPTDAVVQETDLLRKAAGQLWAYLAGEITEFSLPLAPTGTEFQTGVWKELRAIPYGETRSYQDIARNVGKEKACRAVGMANNRNPISIFIPCHRVIGSNGKLVGYGGGLDTKEYLLDLERQHGSL